MRAAGVFGPGREGEDVRRDDIAIVEQFQAVQRHSSVSVGKPAIRSAPIVASVRAALMPLDRREPRRRGYGAASSA